MPENGKYSKADIAGMLQSKLSCGVSNVDEVYINEKAPFGYDYANGDTDAEAVGQSHGVHVAGTVAATTGTISGAWRQCSADDHEDLCR